MLKGAWRRLRVMKLGVEQAFLERELEVFLAELKQLHEEATTNEDGARMDPENLERRNRMFRDFEGIIKSDFRNEPLTTRTDLFNLSKTTSLVCYCVMCTSTNSKYTSTKNAVEMQSRSRELEAAIVEEGHLIDDYSNEDEIEEGVELEETARDEMAELAVLLDQLGVRINAEAADDPLLADAFRRFKETFKAVESRKYEMELLLSRLEPHEVDAIDEDLQKAISCLDDALRFFSGQTRGYLACTDWTLVAENLGYRKTELGGLRVQLEFVCDAISGVTSVKAAREDRENQISLALSYAAVPLVQYMYTAVVVLKVLTEANFDATLVDQLKESSIKITRLLFHAGQRTHDEIIDRTRLSKCWLEKFDRIRAILDDGPRRVRYMISEYEREDGNNIYKPDEIANTFGEAVNLTERAILAKPDMNELLPRFDNVAWNELFDLVPLLADTIRSSSGRLEEIDKLECSSDQLQVFVSRFNSLRDADPPNAEDEPNFHLDSCQSDYFSCPLKGVHHYFVPAIERRISDIDRLLYYSNALIQVILHKRLIPYLDDWMIHLNVIFENLCQLVESEIDLLMKPALFHDSEWLCKAESADTLISFHTLPMVVDCLFCVAFWHYGKHSTVVEDVVTIEYLLSAQWCDRTTYTVTVPSLGAARQLREVARKCETQMAHIWRNFCSKLLRYDMNIAAIELGVAVRLVAIAAGELSTAEVDPDAKRFLHDVPQLRVFPEKIAKTIDSLPVLQLQEQINCLPTHELKPELQSTCAAIASQLCHIRKHSQNLPATLHLSFKLMIYSNVTLARTIIQELCAVCIPFLKRLLNNRSTFHSNTQRMCYQRINRVVFKHINDRLKTVLAKLQALDRYFIAIWENGAISDEDITEKLTRIGAGSFGAVFRREHDQGEATAVKRIAIASREALDSVLRDLEAVQKLKHSGVIRYLDSWFNEDVTNLGARKKTEGNFSAEVAIAWINGETTISAQTKPYAHVFFEMKLYANGTLHDWLEANVTQESRILNKMKTWMAQLCGAMDYVHGEGLIHRDLKPTNIFVSDDDRLVIGDFGLVAVPGIEREERADTSEANVLLTSDCGTFGYMAPEMFSTFDNFTGKVVYDEKVDVFALGRVYARMVVVDRQWQSYLGRETDETEQLPPQIYEEEINFCHWLTSKNASDRPSCAEILRSLYLKDFVEDELISDSDDLPTTSDANRDEEKNKN